MSLRVLDTDSVTLLLHGHAAIERQAAARDPAELALTIVTVQEMLTGWYTQIRRARREDQLIRAYAALQQAVEFCGRIRILPFDEAATERFHQLRSARRRPGTNDLRIAAVVLAHGAILVTRNVRDFKGLPGLQIEDWS
jgi:tRNA(fMet)-specific endonuclease VapC